MLDWAQNCSANVGEMSKVAVVKWKCELKIFVDLNDRVSCRVLFDSPQDIQVLYTYIQAFLTYFRSIVVPLKAHTQFL